jgi:salicylate hydroxylase
MRVLIIGGGIVGLVGALRLRMLGHDVAVYEQAEAIRELGAGIGIWPNATRLLARWGLIEDIARVGVLVPKSRMHAWPAGEVKGAYEHPDVYTLHRQELVRALAARLPAKHVHVGQRCVAVHEDADGVTVDFANGTSARGDLVIAADGIHSAIRASLGVPDPRRDSGVTAFRGLAPADKLVHLGLEPMIYTWWGKHGSAPPLSVLAYPAGPRYWNIGAYILDEQLALRAPGGDPKQRFLATLEGGNAMALEILAAVEETHVDRLTDIDPIDRWVSQRIALVGDAAHAMLPHASQGANQGIEDIAVLALCLQQTDLPAALAKYAEVRKPRAQSIQKYSRDLQQFISYAPANTSRPIYGRDLIDHDVEKGFAS